MPYNSFLSQKNNLLNCTKIYLFKEKNLESLGALPQEFVHCD